jgi:alkylation response protein AidB-like acyl-CoA dehydrogenase
VKPIAARTHDPTQARVRTRTLSVGAGAWPPSRIWLRARAFMLCLSPRSEPRRESRARASIGTSTENGGTGAEAAVGAVEHAIQIHGGNGLSAEYGLVPQWGLARLLRIAPVSREMILNYVAQHSLSLPRSY